jgi:hypothetical protein
MQYPLPPNPDKLPLYCEEYGWYKLDSKQGSDMASVMHNPWGYPTIIEQAAMLVFQRKARFVENYYCKDQLIYILKAFFGDRAKLHSEGLSKQFRSLQAYVETHNLIGLIFWGTDINRIDELIIKYTQVNPNTNPNTTSEIDITINSLCQTLIREYIKESNVDRLCKQTPNFNIYYSALNKDNE